jgi:hypothetical protein
MSRLPTLEDLQPRASSYSMELLERAIMGDDDLSKLESAYLNALADLKAADAHAQYCGHQMCAWQGWQNNANYATALAQAIQSKDTAARDALVEKQNGLKLAYYGWRLSWVSSLIRLRTCLDRVEQIRVKLPDDLARALEKSAPANDPSVLTKYDIDPSHQLNAYLHSAINLSADAINGEGPAILLEAYKQCLAGCYMSRHANIVDLLGAISLTDVNSLKGATPFTLIEEHSHSIMARELMPAFKRHWRRAGDAFKDFPAFAVLQQIQQVKRDANLNEGQHDARRRQALERSPIDEAEKKVAMLDGFQQSARARFVETYEDLLRRLDDLDELVGLLETFVKNVRENPKCVESLPQFHRLCAMYNFVAAAVMAAVIKSWVADIRATMGRKYGELAKRYVSDVAASRRNLTEGRAARFNAFFETLGGLSREADADKCALSLLHGRTLHPL